MAVHQLLQAAGHAKARCQAASLWVAAQLACKHSTRGWSGRCLDMPLDVLRG